MRQGPMQIQAQYPCAELNAHTGGALLGATRAATKPLGLRALGGATSTPSMIARQFGAFLHQDANACTEISWAGAHTPAF